MPFAGTLERMQSIAEIPFIAGHVALDFVNTAEERGHPDAGDVLHTPADLRMWGQRHGLLSRSASSDDEGAELRRAIDVRELLYALFLARVLDHRPTRTDLDRLAALVPPAYNDARLETDTDGHLTWSWNSSQLATVRHVALTAAVDLLARTPPARLKQCPGEHCGWFFLDTTKRGNRRWCSMSECGQDAKTARRRALSKPQRPSPRRPAV
jgi:predicted RNA-binding Zn ribbon-like protein